MVSQSQRKPFMTGEYIAAILSDWGGEMILQTPSLASKLNLEITRTTGIYQH